VDAADLLQSYADDPSAADEQYKGQTIEVTGTIAEVAPSGERHVTLAPDPAAPARVQCFFNVQSTTSLASLRPDQSIRIRGRCEGMSNGNVVLRDCVLVE
jgi:hypothetical protein